MLWNEAGVHNALLEILNVQDHGVVLDGGGHAADDQLIQSTAHAVDGAGPVLCPHYQLAQQGVIVGWNLHTTSWSRPREMLTCLSVFCFLRFR